jgi:ElaA protein
VTIRHALWADLPPHTLHDLVRLRIDVFVVEQGCPYPELDGRDVEPATQHWWAAADDGAVLACLRVLQEPDGALRVGRVCSRAQARGRGLVTALLDAALAAAGGHDVVLDAQSYLAGCYTRRGFVTTGPEYVEDGIAHLPMRRVAGDAGRPDAQASAATSSASGTRGPV